jgi:hypothetical protein
MKHIIICNSSRLFYYVSHPTTDIIAGVVTFNTSCRFTVHLLTDFFYAHKKNTVFPKAVITKIANAHQQCVQVSFSEFHPKPTIHMETTQTHSFTPLSKLSRFPRNSRFPTALCVINYLYANFMEIKLFDMSQTDVVSS